MYFYRNFPFNLIDSTQARYTSYETTYCRGRIYGEVRMSSLMFCFFAKESLNPQGSCFG